MKTFLVCGILALFMVAAHADGHGGKGKGKAIEVDDCSGCAKGAECVAADKEVCDGDWEVAVKCPKENRCAPAPSGDLCIMKLVDTCESEETCEKECETVTEEECTEVEKENCTTNKKACPKKKTPVCKTVPKKGGKKDCEPFYVSDCKMVPRESCTVDANDKTTCVPVNVRVCENKDINGCDEEGPDGEEEVCEDVEEDDCDGSELEEVCETVVEEECEPIETEKCESVDPDCEESKPKCKKELQKICDGVSISDEPTECGAYTCAPGEVCKTEQKCTTRSRSCNLVTIYSCLAA